MSGLNLDTLNCVYFALFFVGVGYALFLVITGGLSDIDMPDVSVDVPQVNLPGDVDIPGAEISISGADASAGGIDAPDVAPSPLSPITIASFITVFGGVGVLGIQLFNTTPGVSLIASTVSGLAASGLMYLFYSQFLIRSQGSSELRRGELIGMHAEVTVPIGENATGQVTYRTKAGRMNSMARSLDNRPIPRGEFVQIVRVIGSQVLVVPLAANEDQGPSD
jgi:membrane protein implicated in regulation of membrane protease activity